MNGGGNAVVRSAATNVRHRIGDLGVGRLRLLLQEGGCRHDLARLTIPALRHLLGDPRLLDGMRGIPRKALDRVNLLPRDGGNRYDTRARRHAVDVNGATSALRHAATEL